MKRRVYASYGRTRQTGVCCEVDHLIPLALGGSNSPQNLWPQPYTGEWTAAEKDKLENRLHKLVCSGQLDLTTAQEAISSNWVVAFRVYLGSEGH